MSDEGTHFINKVLTKMLSRSGVKHVRSLLYHLQAKVSNKDIKSILIETINANKKDWSLRLDEALWACRMAFKTPIRMSPYKLGFGKACHLPLDLEHKAYQILKILNLDFEDATK